MAQFKLGRIRFVWQGVWVTGTTYAVDDVVSVGGKSYICQINHIASSTFVTDLIAIPAKWNIIADGTTWRGDWSPQTLYNAGDEVKYGGIVYIATTGHTSANNTASTLTITNLDNISQPGSVILSYQTTTPTPFPIGSSITIAGANTGYNGAYTVTNSTTSTVTYTNATNTVWNGSGTIYTYGGLESSQSYWNQFAPSFFWKGNWTVNTRYKVNDFVAYGGYVYVCTIAHQSASTILLGLENNINDWQIFNNGIDYVGTWSGSAVRYRVNDVVKWGSDLWICTSPHSSTGTSIDTSQFSIFVNGFEFKNSWSIGGIYEIGDMVTYGGYTYVAILNNTGQTPTTSPTFWQPFSTGFSFLGDWISSTAYKIGSVVRLGGYTYVATADNTSQTPSLVSSYWSKLNAGFNWTNSSYTYSNIAGTNITGSGSGATFDITCSNTVYTIVLHAGITMSGYLSGNTIKILGTQVGGQSPSNDILLTVNGVNNGAITTFTISGRSVTWITGKTYYQGDVTFFGSSSYICIQPHTSSSGNRPDADTTGLYWNAIAVGTESAALTTTGDLLYYGGNGPTRLPIGTEGQILRSTNGYPVWANYGLINNLVYVGPLGQDVPAPNYGLTIDKPWKTVRYAAYQIEQGYLNPNAKSLLVRNKQFAMKEVNNYLSYTYTATITNFSTGNYQFTCSSTASFNIGMPITFSASYAGVTAGTVYYINTIVDLTHFTIKTTYTGSIFALTGSFSNSFKVNFYYDPIKTERDLGLTYEGIVYDLTRGGTLKTVTNAKAYFTTAGNTFITANTGYQITQFIASQLYFENTLLPAILGGTAPSQNYQTLNGISSGSQAIQIIDNTITAESQALSYAQGLVAIITNAMTAGSATSIPTPFQPNTTIDIKTGTYNEVLPIVLAENTALVGDELRTSVVQPAVATTNLVNDIPKTTSALNRISAILPAILTNQSVTPTSGNTQTQITTLPAGDIGSAAAVTNAKYSAKVLYDVFANGLNNLPTLVQPIPNGYGSTLTNVAWAATGNTTGSTSTYDSGTAQVVQNYAFIKAEVVAYLNTYYSSVWTTFGATNQAETQRDVGFVLDAIRYDLTYGGNRMSLITGSAYWSNYTNTILPAYLPATLAALTRVKVILGQIVQAQSVTVSSGNVTAQVTTGNPGNAACAVFVQNLVQNIINWVNNGYGDTAVLPYVGWASTDLQTAFNAVQAKRSEIAYDATAWIQKFYQSVSYNIVTSTRDAGLIVDAICYDMLNGGNFNAIKAGSRFYAPISSNQVVLSTELSACLGAVNFIKYKIAKIAATGSVVAAQTTINDITQYIAGIGKVGTVWPPTAASISNTYSVAAQLILDNKLFIRAEIIAYISTNYPSVVYNSDKCSRDVDYIIDALVFDMRMGGNWATRNAGAAYNSNLYGLEISVTEITATLAAYRWLKTLVQNIATNSTSFTPAQGTVTQIRADTLQAVGNSNAATAVGNLVTLITNIISSTSLNAGVQTINITTIAGQTTFTTGTTSNTITATVAGPAVTLGTAASYLVGTPILTGSISTSGGLAQATTYYVAATTNNSTSVTLASSLTNAQNGTALSFTAASYSSNNTITVGTALHGLNVGDAVIPQSTSNNLVTGTWYFVASVPTTSTFTLAASYGGATITSFTNGTVLSIVSEKINLPSTANVSASNLSAYQTLSGVKATIQSLISTFITTNYPTLTYNTDYCQRDIGYVIDMIGFDLMLGSNYLTLCAARSYFQAQAAKAIGVQKKATVQSYRYLNTQMISAVTTNTSAVTTINTLFTGFIAIITGGINEIPEINGTVTYNNTLSTINGVEILRANTAFLTNEATAWINANFGGTLASISGLGVTTTTAHNLLAGDPVVFSGGSAGGITVGVTYYVLQVLSPTSFSITSTYGGTTTVPLSSVGSPTLTAGYYFNVASCQRDMTEYIKALIYDLQYPGNYKSLRAAELYRNAVIGSQLSDMFHVRQSCGIRNMTLNGLNGDLTQVNSYGTRRPTAGAYTSLDPGFGPNDTNVWINTRSTYCQNVSLFGTGCTGMKIDGALHQGGNRSIVANDYTTILSDGIGVWCTGHSALTELVSVFCYYSYSGYLSELGGRIRATNGNSSYGTWGVIAEGTDTQETPLYANLNNRASQAYVTNVFTDSINQIYRLEFENAGGGYTNATTAISGTGYNVYVTNDEFRDASVFETRITDPLNTGSSGGIAYGQALNAGQGGTLYQITIAATDVALSPAYIGMRIVLTGGTGVGQSGAILNYSNGSKVALVYKESFITLPITATNLTTNVNNTAGVLVAGRSNNTVFAPCGTQTGVFAPGMILTSSGTITLGTYITGSANISSGVTSSIASPTISTTGTIGTIVGTGTQLSPWQATITGMSSTINFVVGCQITATNGTGTLFGGSPTSVVVTGINSSTSITYQAVGGTTPTAGSVTNIKQTVLTVTVGTNVHPGMALSGGSVTASYIAGQISATGTILATATFTGAQGSNSIVLSSFSVGTMSTLAIGQFIAPISGIPAGTYITSVTPTTSTITVNINLYAAVSASTNVYAFGGPGTYALTAASFGTITGTPTGGTSWPVSPTQSTYSATISGTLNSVTVASTATLYNGMGVYLDTTANGLTSNTLYYILALVAGGTSFSLSTSNSNGVAQSVTAGSVNINLYAAGWDHVVPGTAISSTLDLTTNYSIEPRITYTSPGYTTTGRTLSASTTWGQIAYGANRYVAVATGGTTTSYSLDGKNWSAGGAATGLSGTLANRIVFGGGYGAIYTATVGGLGGSGATFTVFLGVANSTGAPGVGQIASIAVTNGGSGYTSPPTIVITDNTGSNCIATATVLSGSIQTVTVSSNGSGYTNPTITAITSKISSFNVVQYGYGYNSIPQIIVSDPFTATAWTSSATASQGTTYSYLGNFYSATSNGTFTTVGPSFTTGSSTNGTVSLTYIGTTATGTAVTTNYGVSSITITNAGYGYVTTPTVTIADASAQFVGITAGGTATSYLPIWSNGTAVAPTTAWSAGNTLPASTFTSLAYGLGTYVAIGGTASASSSNDGVSWTARTIPTLSSGTYSAVTWGAGSYQQFTNGTYVAISTGSNATAFSFNGSSWTVGGNLPQTSTWISVAYGNNRYVAIASNQTYVAFSLNAGLTWTQAPAGLPSAANWTQITYGQGLFFAVASGTNIAATSPDGINWTSVVMPSSSNWNSVAFGSIPTLTIAGNSPLWVAVSSTSGTVAASMHTGVTSQGRMKVGSGIITEVRMWEPGSSYPKGIVLSTSYVAGTVLTVNSSTTTVITLSAAASLTQGQAITFTSNVGSFITAGTIYYVYATTSNSLNFSITTSYLGVTALTVGTTIGLTVSATVRSLNTITVDNTENIIANQPIEFQGCTTAGLATNTTYYVIGASITSTTFQVTATNGNSISVIVTPVTISSGIYTCAPIYTIGDNNHTTTVNLRVRTGDGSLGNPSFINRGTLNTTASSLITGDGYADLYQANNFISVSNLFAIPQPGANIVFSTIPGVWYKLVTISNILGISGNYSAVFQISPGLTVYNAPPNNTLMTTTIKYSQTRLTGHDFLYIGTGNQAQTNYPFVVPTNAIQANQTSGTGGGRVFFTSTDQDGNFNVGNLFGVQQATGTATLNANAFNLSGLQSLTLSGLSLGVGSATITQFSTDPYFTANSDNVLPTQRAIKSYITAQIGGGQSTLNVNTLTAGVIYIANNTISTTSGGQINVTAKMNFTGGIDGAPVALGFFLQR